MTQFNQNDKTEFFNTEEQKVSLVKDPEQKVSLVKEPEKKVSLAKPEVHSKRPSSKLKPYKPKAEKEKLSAPEIMFKVFLAVAVATAIGMTGMGVYSLFTLQFEKAMAFFICDFFHFKMAVHTIAESNMTEAERHGFFFNLLDYLPYLFLNGIETLLLTAMML